MRACLCSLILACSRLLRSTRLGLNTPLCFVVQPARVRITLVALRGILLLRVLPLLLAPILLGSDGSTRRPPAPGRRLAGAFHLVDRPS